MATDCPVDACTWTASGPLPKQERELRRHLIKDHKKRERIAAVVGVARQMKENYKRTGRHDG